MSRRRPKTLYEKELEEQKLQEMLSQSQAYKKYENDIRRGDIFYFDKSIVTGVEQQGGRPGVVVSNDMCNESSEFLLVCYLTTQPKTNLPTHVPVLCEQKSICLCEQVHTLSKEKLQRFCCKATPEEMKEIDKALVISLGIDLENLLTSEYDNILNQLSKKDEKIKILEEYMKQKDAEIKCLENDISILQNKIESSKAIQSIEDAPDYIRVCAERDVYMKLYYELLNRK